MSKRSPHPAAPDRLLRRTVVATILLAACSGTGAGSTQDSVADSGDASRPVEDTSDLAGDGMNDSGPSDSEPDFRGAPCTGPVCWELLEPDQHPEAMDPPQSALHCNELGLAIGCPAGWECGEPEILSDGRRVPVCTPIDGAGDDFDIEIPSALAEVPADEQSVDVDLHWSLEGFPLPARNADRFAADPWSSRVRITHRDSGRQWVAPLPHRLDSPTRLRLLPGTHDVLILLRAEDYPDTGIVSTDVRGVLRVEGQGEAEIEVPIGQLQVRLRYLGSTLTSAESAAMVLTFLSESGKRLVRGFTGAERGLASVGLPWGVYRVELATNGSLPGLFPSVGMELPARIAIPEDTSLQVDLEPVLLRGTLQVNGEPAGAGSSVLFAREGRWQQIALTDDDPGRFRALLWPYGPSDVYFWNGRGAVGLIESDWSPSGSTEIAFDVDVDEVRVRVPREGLGSTEGTELNLTMMHASAPFASQVWLGAAEEGADVFEWRADMVPGERVDFALNAYSANGPRGTWGIAEEVVVAPVMELDHRVVPVETSLRFRWADGGNISFTQATVYFEEPGLMGGMTSWYTDVRSGSWSSGWARSGLAQASAWSNGGGPLAYQRYDIGTVDVRDNASLSLEAVVHELNGDLLVDGERWSGPRDGSSSRYLTLSRASYGGSTYYFEPNRSSFEAVVGSGVYQVWFGCWSSGCSDEGIGTTQVLVWDGLRID